MTRARVVPPEMHIFDCAVPRKRSPPYSTTE
jgi:hypothetical protein